MTHWVILEHEGRIYAGADTLVSFHEFPSVISGSGSMPQVHNTTTTSKVIAFSGKFFDCVICTAAILNPTHIATQERRWIIPVLCKFLSVHQHDKLKSASDLMRVIQSHLEGNYTTVEGKNGIFLGCGFHDHAGHTSISYYDSKQDIIVDATKGYLNSQGAMSVKPNLASGIGTLLKLNPAEFRIKEEIFKVSANRQDAVGKEAEILSIPLEIPKVSFGLGMSGV